MSNSVQNIAVFNIFNCFMDKVYKFLDQSSPFWSGKFWQIMKMIQISEIQGSPPLEMFKVATLIIVELKIEIDSLLGSSISAAT